MCCFRAVFQRLVAPGRASSERGSGLVVDLPRSFSKAPPSRAARSDPDAPTGPSPARRTRCRSEEHTSELQSLMRLSSAVFCLKKKKMNSLQTSLNAKQHIHYHSHV